MADKGSTKVAVAASWLFWICWVVELVRWGHGIYSFYEQIQLALADGYLKYEDVVSHESISTSIYSMGTAIALHVLMGAMFWLRGRK